MHLLVGIGDVLLGKTAMMTMMLLVVAICLGCVKDMDNLVVWLCRLPLALMLNY